MLLPTPSDGDYSAAVSYNVLEHIEDHVGALRSMRDLVRPGGAVVLIVPAFLFAMSPADIATGHVRRYTKKTLHAALTEAGLTVEKLHYANALGLIGYFMATSVFRLMPKEGPMVKVYDTLVLPATKAAEQVVRPPFGQSVFAVAAAPPERRRRCPSSTAPRRTRRSVFDRPPAGRVPWRRALAALL